MQTSLSRKYMVALVGLSLVLFACNIFTPTAGQVTVLSTVTVLSSPTGETPTITPTDTLTATPTPTFTITPTNTATQTPTATPIAYGPSGFPANVDPLTGQTVSDANILNRRPVIIKVSNFPANGRPHAGLSFADIVFEYYIGEGTNRFAALYYGQDSTKVGPVRSGRRVDAQLGRMYQSILGYDSADQTLVNPIIVKALGNRAISLNSFTCPALCDTGAHTVTSVFANTSELSQFAASHQGVINQRQKLDGMSFDSRTPTAGQIANTVDIFFNLYDQGEWRYNPSTGQYLRWIESTDSNNKVTLVQLTDRDTGQQLSFSNIVVVYAVYNQIAPTLHDINLWYDQSGRRAILFRDGQAVDGIWKSGGTDSPLRFYNSQNAPMPFKPGNTWMVFMGVNSKLQQASSGQWIFQFYLP
ncbi:MAG TPA: DUF3048 domain-containing protein [Anaerolineaceae bacterium]|nr:DUF3048 domain-containing protein [Anaerolineaceae bacterium]